MSRFVTSAAGVYAVFSAAAFFAVHLAFAAAASFFFVDVLMGFRAPFTAAGAAPLAGFSTVGAAAASNTATDVRRSCVALPKSSEACPHMFFPIPAYGNREATCTPCRG